MLLALRIDEKVDRHQALAGLTWLRYDIPWFHLTSTSGTQTPQTTLEVRLDVASPDSNRQEDEEEDDDVVVSAGPT